MSGGVEGVALLPMSEAPKDGSYIVGYYLSLDNERTKHWDGRAFVIRHEGKTASNYDLGWGLFPGYGGVPDICFAGWSPLPSALTAPPARTYAEGDSETQWEVWEDDLMVASSTDEADAQHYLAVYSQDGPVRLVKAVTVRTPCTEQGVTAS